MKGYLGEFDVSDEEGEDYDPIEMALYIMEENVGIDGGHHKAWVLDQVARVLHKSPVRHIERRWDNGLVDHRYDVEDNEAYHEWVRKVKDGEDGPDTYSYDEGIAP